MCLNAHFCELFCGLVSDNVVNGDVFLLVSKHCGICRRSLYPSCLAWEENAQLKLLGLNHEGHNSSGLK